MWHESILSFPARENNLIQFYSAEVIWMSFVPGMRVISPTFTFLDLFLCACLLASLSASVLRFTQYSMHAWVCETECVRQWLFVAVARVLDQPGWQCLQWLFSFFIRSFTLSRVFLCGCTSPLGTVKNIKLRSHVNLTCIEEEYVTWRLQCFIQELPLAKRQIFQGYFHNKSFNMKIKM